eukprot:2558519-Rhodomonas_salina.2
MGHGVIAVGHWTWRGFHHRASDAAAQDIEHLASDTGRAIMANIIALRLMHQGRGGEGGRGRGSEKART